MNENSDHHVAWADRIGLNKQWAKDIMVCSEAFGSEYYPTAVNRFRNDIINVKSGPLLKDIIDDYVDDTLLKWKQEELVKWVKDHPQEAMNPSWTRNQKKNIELRMYEYLYNFMIQLLEDYGFVFYESNVEEDEMS